MTRWGAVVCSSRSSRYVFFINSLVGRKQVPAEDLTNLHKYVPVSEHVPSYGAMLHVQVYHLGDDMSYFACKFFSDSPPSEPTESDSGAGLKTEVCFYD